MRYLWLKVQSLKFEYFCCKIFHCVNLPPTRLRSEKSPCCLHTVDHFSKMIFNDAWGMPSLSEIRLFRQSVNEWKTRKVTGFHLHYCIALRSSGKWMNFWRRSDLYYSEKFHEYVIKGMLELLLCSRVTKILEFLT